MNFCPYCGKELDDAMLFCPYCGKNVPKPEDSSAPHRQKKSLRSPKLLLSLAAVILIAIVLLIRPFGSRFSDDPQAIGKAAGSVVKLTCYDYNGLEHCRGSGFAVFDKGVIVTNYHVISGNTYSIEVQADNGEVYPVDSVIAYNEEQDLAILRVPDCPLKPLKVGDSRNLNKGENLVSIGSPIGFANTVSTGIFSNYLDTGTHIEILSTASISHGSSGGALFNDKGRVIGITSGEYTGGNDLYYSMPIHYAQELYDTRTPEKELTVAALYDQTEHPYTVDYVIAYGGRLQNTTITVHGYISGIDPDIFLVSSPEHVLNIDVRDTRGVLGFEQSLTLRELRSEEYAVQIDTADLDARLLTLKPGDYIEVVGTVRYYDSTDIRIVAKDINKIS
ncbi:MAG: trypsin-like peptidase domain-containing protein [Oscillospiraceae bacterium]|nr:trypsin-like peptidase domain-containing protein [Oscillospiraceae bacterium]